MKPAFIFKAADKPWSGDYGHFKLLF